MREVFRLIWKCNPKGFIRKLLYTLCTSLLPLVGLYLLKLLVDAVTGAVATGGGAELLARGSSLGVLLLAFCGVTLVGRWIGVLSSVNNDVLTQQLVDYINGVIQQQSVALDLAYYDTPRYYDTFHRAQQEAALRPIRILESFVAVVGAVVSLAGVGVMMLFASWQVVLVMLLAVLPTFVVRLYKSRRIYRFRRESTQLQRRSSYYGTLLTSRQSAKEVRCYGLAELLQEGYRDIRRRLVKELLTIARRLAVVDAVTAVVEVGALFAALLCMVRPALEGVLSIGTFVMLFEAFRRGQGYLGTMVAGISGLYEHKLFIGNLFDFLRLKAEIVSPTEPVPFPERVERVDFEDITFTYPDMSRPTLTHYSLSARCGEIAVIEGENGFGKSTLLKLLLRLYDPQEGAVRINGIDVRCFDLKELRRHVCAMFQDYVQFQFTVRENIAFGDIEHAEDARRMAEALRLSDAEGLVERLGQGLDTPLGRYFDDGEELSMGQWQRIALARLIYSQAPVLVFDEPTAWMDAAARRRFAQSLEELKQGRIILLVRHSESLGELREVKGS